MIRVVANGKTFPNFSCGVGSEGSIARGHPRRRVDVLLIPPRNLRGKTVRMLFWLFVRKIMTSIPKS
jgi:hypothetical protein